MQELPNRFYFSYGETTVSECLPDFFKDPQVQKGKTHYSQIGIKVKEFLITLCLLVYNQKDICF